MPLKLYRLKLNDSKLADGLKNDLQQTASIRNVRC